ncbi:MAG: ATP phosphoribosyltransferase [Chitinophagales bacterium]
MNDTLKIALQKSGRLSEGSMKLLSNCGVNVSNNGRRLMAQASNFPLEILFLRDDDIPEYVEDNVADIGVLGLNVVKEKNKSVDIVEKLGFSKCRLSLAIDKNQNYTGPSFFNEKQIATSYPNILKEWLQENNVKTDVHEISGSVEIAPGIGLAEAICDIVSTGSTLFSNGLKEVETIMHSEAVMIANRNLSSEKQTLLEKLIFRINAVNKAKTNRYILLNAPNEKLEQIISILPGMKSPTVTPLADKDWSSVHSVIGEEAFWEVIDQLKLAGAEGILVVPIEKMVL